MKISQNIGGIKIYIEFICWFHLFRVFPESLLHCARRWRNEGKSHSHCHEETHSLSKKLPQQYFRKQEWNYKDREGLHCLDCSARDNGIVKLLLEQKVKAMG